MQRLVKLALEIIQVYYKGSKLSCAPTQKLKKVIK